jgi:hypothetical protein
LLATRHLWPANRALGRALRGNAWPPACPLCGDGRQTQNERKVVVRGDVVEPFPVAAMTTVQHDVLAVVTDERADRGHRCAAGRGAVAWTPIIDVARVETDGAVVAMPAARWQRADQQPAVPATKVLFAGRVRSLRFVASRMRPALFFGTSVRFGHERSRLRPAATPSSFRRAAAVIRVVKARSNTCGVSTVYLYVRVDGVMG